MDTIAERKVGMFVFFGSLLLILTVFLIGGNRSLFSSTYELNVRFSEVQGISKGSVVQLIGLPVGNVTRIDFGKDQNLVVVLEINKEYQDKITSGSTAGVRTQGALGDKFIYIKPGSPDAPILNNGDFLITETGGDFFSTIARHGNDISQVFDIIADLRQLIKDLNGNGEMKEVVANLKSTTEDLKVFTKGLNANQSGDKLKESINKLNQILAKIENGSGTLGAIINDKSLYKKLQQLTGTQQVNPIKSAIRDSIRETESN